LRPGRFDKVVYVPNPDSKTRQKILEINTKGKPVSYNIDLKRIADLMDGFSGADASAVANTAISLVLHEHLEKHPTPEEATKHASEAFVSMHHFEEAVRKVKKQREMKPEEKTNVLQYM
jgi:transitional endoplasmic reticulum ATPase